MRHTNITLTNRHIGWLISVVIVISLGSFGAGYFWGEKKSAERFLQRIGQEAFADQVYSSVCSMYDSENEIEVRSENGNEGYQEESDKTQEVVKKEAQQEIIQEINPKVAYYAQLVGFGTAKKAKQFVERLTRNGIVAHVRERKSKSARGKVILWYQVVSDPYTNKDALISLVEKIKHDEHLHDVRIITV